MKFSSLAIAAALLTAPSIAFQGARYSPRFGPELTHRSFDAPSLAQEAPQMLTSFNALRKSSEPVKIAEEFMRTLTGSDFVVKRDYYTDKHTGVTHVYIKQRVNGLEVVDADVNINIDANGRIISYGNSFFDGQHPTTEDQTKPDSLRKQMTVVVEELQEVKASLMSLLKSKSRFAKPKERVHRHRVAHSDQVVFDEEEEESMFYALIMPDEETPESRSHFGKLVEMHKEQIKALEGQIKSYEEDVRHHRSSAPVMSGPLEALDGFLNKLQLVSDATDFSGVTIQMEHSLQGKEPSLELHNVPGALSPVKARQAYVQVPDATTGGMKLALVWDLEIEMENNWFNAHVDAFSPETVHSVHDWVSDAVYNVFPFGTNDPSDGKRKNLTDPHDTVASRDGWHDQGKKKSNFTKTIGNNVYAQENFEGLYNWEDNYRPDGGKKLVFDFPLNMTSKPKDYIDAAVTNLFYVNNMIHDLFYRYGFDEVAGNFQENNYGNGGKGGDAVVANAQDGSGYNNANFATPPDGQNGKMRMYVWDVIDPYRDGDLEAGIIIHEYAHGISTRLTGGPANSNCLGWGEAGGMGEGWGDFFATVIRMDPKTHNYTSVYDMGSWANGGDGIRSYPYTTDTTLNPESYKVMDQPGYWGVHAKGEVWAGMLYEVVQLLIEKHGMAKSIFPPTNSSMQDDFYRKGSNIPKNGNTLALQLVVDGMKLQPCRPSFMDARDAIIQADDVLTGGVNKCLLWEGFTKRGLGPKAELVGSTPWGGGVRTEDKVMPKKCKQSKEW